MTEPLWLQRVWVDALHFQLLKRFGGAYGVREEGTIDAALARPRNKWAYDSQVDLATLAAAYAYGLTRSHGYVDGNKRIGFLAMAVFLELNGSTLEATELEVVRVMVAVAAGKMEEPELADWVRQRTVPQ
jgi:death-on-curing protein